MKYPVLLLICLLLPSGFLSAQNGLKGEYFRGKNFDRKVLTRVDPQINFYWDHVAPAPGMPMTDYSIRWTGRITAPKTGEYTFAAMVDDGLRLWVGGIKVIDAWGPHDHEFVSGQVGMKEGKTYDIRIEYFNGILEGQIQLHWEIPDPNKSLLDRVVGKKEIIGRKFFALPPPPQAEPVPEALAVNSPARTEPKNEPKSEPKSDPEPERKPEKKEPAPKLNPTPTAPVTPSAPVVKVNPNAAPGSPKRTRMMDTIDKYTPRNILFEQGEPFIKEESFPELDRLVELLQRFEGLRVTVEGHTDVTGDPDQNLQLSKDRASEVAYYLKKKGIDAARISTRGYGSSKPLFGKDSTRLYPQNRRVEFKIN